MNSNSMMKIVGAGLAGVVLCAPGVASAVNLEAESVYPQVLFDDTNHAGNEWAIVGLDAIFAIQDLGRGTTILSADPSEGSVGIGYFADSNAGSSVAIGYNAETQGSFSTALGFNALTTEWSATALGRDSVAGGSSSVALGERATTAGVQNFAAGYDAYAVGERSVALGWAATTEGDDSLAYGRGATTSINASSSAAIGRGASAYGLRSLAVGNLARSDGSYSTAVGEARTQGADSVAVGREADTALAGASGVAIGPYSLVSKTAGVALGYAAGSFETYSTAIGPYAMASQPWSLVLGSIAGSNGAPEYTDVAIGTTEPLASLHVARDDGTAGILVSEADLATGPRTLFEIENNGNPEFRMTNTANGNSWAFSAGLRFVVKNNLGDWVMRVTDTGNLEIGGTLMEMSDRNRKHAIVPLDGDAVLAKLEQVPVSEWAYDDESADQRHIGPMAQDFHAAFGLASGEKAISARDMAGVNMAAVQALITRNAELEERIARLEKLAQQWLEPASLQVAQGD